MTEKTPDAGRVPAEPGSREPSPAVSAFGFDPSRGFLLDDQEEIPGDDADTDHGRAYWDARPRPGRTDDDPMCINLYCPSAFSCRRFSQVPWQGETGTVFIDPEPKMLNGLLCEDFDPDCPLPSRDSDGSPKGGDGEAVSVHDSAAIAQPTPNSPAL